MYRYVSYIKIYQCNAIYISMHQYDATSVTKIQKFCNCAFYFNLCKRDFN